MALSEYQKQLSLIRQGLAAKTTGPKPKKPLRKISPAKAQEMKREREERGDDDTELQKWYRNRIKQLTGRCNECGAKVETKIYQYAIASVCHLLAKRKEKCPSVSINPFNFIELCPDHHQKFDNSSWEEIEKWGIWPEVRDRLILVYPDLAIEERRHFPESVLKYMEKIQKELL